MDLLTLLAALALVWVTLAGGWLLLNGNPYESCRTTDNYHSRMNPNHKD